MNKEGYAAICNKCGSPNIEIAYKKTKFSENSKETSTPVKCNACKCQTKEHLVK